MRAYVFRKLLKYFIKRMPGLFIGLELQILLEISKSSYKMPGKIIMFLPAEKALEEYVIFSVKCMESGKDGSDKLYPKAYALGKKIRQITGFKKEEDLRQLVFWLYKNIRITMKGELPGDLIIPKCYFSKFYTPAQCRLMSNVDAGVIAGIFGGGELVFSERITEGCGRCRACFVKRSENE